MNLGILAAAFAVIFPAELPDKSTIAALILGTKYKPQHVYVGIAAAFAVQVVIAVAAGSLLFLLPHKILQLVVGVLFGIGAVLIVMQGGSEDETIESEIEGVSDTDSFWKVSLTAFGVVFLAEFGDLTQIATANLVAKFGHPVSVGIGSVLALWAVGAIGVWGGKSLVRVIPMKLFTVVAASLLGILAVVTLLGAL